MCVCVSERERERERERGPWGGGEDGVYCVSGISLAYTVVPFFVQITRTSVSLDTVARRLLLANVIMS